MSDMATINNLQAKQSIPGNQNDLLLLNKGDILVKNKNDFDKLVGRVVFCIIYENVKYYFFVNMPSIYYLHKDKELKYSVMIDFHKNYVYLESFFIDRLNEEIDSPDKATGKQVILVLDRLMTILEMKYMYLGSVADIDICYMLNKGSTYYLDRGFNFIVDSNSFFEQDLENYEKVFELENKTQQNINIIKKFRNSYVKILLTHENNMFTQSNTDKLTKNLLKKILLFYIFCIDQNLYESLFINDDDFRSDSKEMISDHQYTDMSNKLMTTLINTKNEIKLLDITNFKNCYDNANKYVIKFIVKLYNKLLQAHNDIYENSFITLQEITSLLTVFYIKKYVSDPQSGGHDNKYYLHKYLKYKTKYLNINKINIK
ncbi:MAG: hypothetical protein Terrestrivirus1_319 [Terrestrivirus sp.]|uniref:Uncharacterized protein n=1 Tax=Terrestrivirus sp. TaxID=2487775 RepID=A0A3G4ZKT2_9VIRU|nr:MAG: hypothetical protein Terrestrivirus1_319 [Terrestrivirus sp.]